MQSFIKVFSKTTPVYLFLIVFNLVCLPLFSQLSQKSEISLLTISQGDELYSSFGHSALLISDPDLGIDHVYNYGTFSFDDDFYVKFTKGQLDYLLSISSFEDEYYAWVSLENRSVMKQVLNLTLEEKNQLFRFLENNALPENRVYRYDYFYDNCSNRLDKALISILGDRLKFYAADVAKEHNRSGASIRQLTHDYLLQNQWGELGIETCLGIEMDRKIKPEQFKFLPDYLMWNYDKARIESNGKQVPLVKEKIVVYKSTQDLTSRPPFFSGPNLIFSIIFIFALIFSIPVIHATFFARLFDFILFFACGTIGLLLIFLWFFTVHYSQVNLNILWANPVSFVLAFLFFNKKYMLKLSTYYFGYGLLLLLTIILWSLLPQHLNNAYLFICMALVTRCFANFRYPKTVKTAL